MSVDIAEPMEQARPQSSIDTGYNPNVIKNIEKHMDQLSSEQQDFIVAHLTPEFAGIMGLILGQEAFDFFNKYADPNKILVPMSREEVQGLANQSQGAVPVQQPPQAAPSGPQQGPLA